MHVQHPKSHQLWREMIARPPQPPAQYSVTSYPAFKNATSFSDATRLLIHISKPHFEPGELVDVVSAFEAYEWTGDEMYFATIIVHENGREIAQERDLLCAYSPLAAERLMLQVPAITEIKPGIYTPPEMRKTRTRTSEARDEIKPESYADVDVGLRDVLTPEGREQAEDFLRTLKDYHDHSLPDAWLLKHVVGRLEERWPTIAAVDVALSQAITITLTKIAESKVMAHPKTKLPRWWLGFAVALSNGRPSAAKASCRTAYKAACLAQRGENPYAAVAA